MLSKPIFRIVIIALVLSCTTAGFGCRKTGDVATNKITGQWYIAKLPQGMVLQFIENYRVTFEGAEVGTYTLGEESNDWYSDAFPNDPLDTKIITTVSFNVVMPGSVTDAWMYNGYYHARYWEHTGEMVMRGLTYEDNARTKLTILPEFLAKLR